MQEFETVGLTEFTVKVRDKCCCAACILLFSLRPQSLKLSLPYSGWIFPPQLTQKTFHPPAILEPPKCRYEFKQRATWNCLPPSDVQATVGCRNGHGTKVLGRPYQVFGEAF